MHVTEPDKMRNVRRCVSGVSAQPSNREDIWRPGCLHAYLQHYYARDPFLLVIVIPHD
jgi:hypothetical protein